MKFESNFPPEFWKQFERLENIDEIAPKMLQAAAPVAVESIKRQLQKHNNTGELISSVKARKPKKAKRGGYVQKIEFAGYDRNRPATEKYPKGVPNAVKAAGLEFGNANEPARPFLETAARDCEQEAAEQMQQVFDTEVAIHGTS